MRVKKSLILGGIEMNCLKKLTPATSMILKSLSIIAALSSIPLSTYASADALSAEDATIEEIDYNFLMEEEQYFSDANESALSYDDQEQLSIAAASGPAAWSHIKGTVSWTQAVVSVVRSHFSKLERAKDISLFCPGYHSSSRSSRETCWIRLVSAVSKFESSFNPHSTFREPNGAMSIGLLALSPGECANASSSAALKNPTRNLICGTRKMAELISAHGYIDGPASRRGAAAYWSVLRKPYRHGKYKLGKKDQIIAITRQFKQVTPVR